MAEKQAKANQQAVDAILTLLPKEPEQAVGVSIATCAATCIDAGLDDEDAVHGLRAAMKTLRKRGAGGRRH